MKKFLLFAICVIAFSSCYNCKVLIGNVKPETPMVEVNTVWNHHLIYGLLPLNNATMEASKYLEGRQNYMVKTHQTFVNLLVNYLTFGIYTPTQTTFYVPLSELNR